MTDEEIQAAVDKCATVFNPGCRVPFPIKELGDKDDNLLITLADYEDDNVSGFITYDKTSEKYKMFINTNKPQKRINFTVAHELGHYFLHRDIIRGEKDFLEKEETLDSGDILYRKDEDRAMSEEEKKYEREANRFAAKLLMPEQYVRKAWMIFWDISTCALIFDVSEIAMSIRLNELGILNNE